jgi:preprotein translocase subunit SecD
MMNRRTGFNLYLVMLLSLAAGCKTEGDKEKDLVSTFRVHLETGLDLSGQSETVSIFRENPTTMNVEKEPFLTEADVSDVKVLNALGDFEIQVHFDRGGSWRLEQITTAYRGKHMAIFTQFTPTPGAKKTETRWLGAPRISKRITDGVITFTPDATHEEAEEIVKGLKNVAKKAQKDSL